MAALKSPARQVIVSVLLIVVVFIAFLMLTRLWGSLPVEANHFGTVMIVLVIVSVIEHMFLHLRFERWIQGIMRQIGDGDNRTGNEVAAISSELRTYQRTIEPIRDALSQYSLALPALAAGLTQIYPNRAAAERDVMNSIREAKKVSILGIAFSEAVSMAKLVDELTTKCQDLGATVQILLLDPLRSPAVFRSFFESTAERVKETITRGDGRLAVDHPYFKHNLYRDFLNTYNTLEKSGIFESRVRFYAHSPSCWLLIIDNEAYFQPYTVGSSLEKSDGRASNLRLGAYLPVFRFHRRNESGVFEVLEDHFNKLWLTTDVDMFHMQARLQDKVEIVGDIFRKRFHWLNHVYTTLHDIEGKEHRKYPRQPCRTKGAKLKNGFILSWDQNGTKAEASLENFSSHGLGLKLIMGTCPNVGERLSLSVSPKPETLGARFIIERLLQTNYYQFEVAHVTRYEDTPRSSTQAANIERTFIGLKPTQYNSKSGDDRVAL